MMNHFFRLSALSCLALGSFFGLMATSQTPDKSNIIFKYNSEKGDFRGVARQYQETTCSQSSYYINNSLFQIVKAPVRKGKYAVKHQIKNCDERSELAIPGKIFQVEQEYWIGWSYFIPDNFIQTIPEAPTFTLIQQMGYFQDWIDQNTGKMLVECNQKIVRNGVETTRGAPGSYLSISPNGKSYQYVLKYYKGLDEKGRYIFGCKSFSIPAKLNQWEDFVMHVKFSAAPNVGFVELWKNNQLYFSEKVALLRHGSTALSAWKIGAYVGDPNRGERTLYTDELKVGNQHSFFNEVSPKDRVSFKYLVKQFFERREIR